MMSNKFFAGFATAMLRIKVCVRNEHLCTVLNSTANKCLRREIDRWSRRSTITKARMITNPGFAGVGC